MHTVVTKTARKVRSHILTQVKSQSNDVVDKLRRIRVRSHLKLPRKWWQEISLMSRKNQVNKNKNSHRKNGRREGSNVFNLNRLLAHRLARYSCIGSGGYSKLPRTNASMCHIATKWSKRLHLQLGERHQSFPLMRLMSIVSRNNTQTASQITPELCELAKKLTLAIAT